jgi:hypothetical protein
MTARDERLVFPVQSDDAPVAGQELTDDQRPGRDGDRHDRDLLFGGDAASVFMQRWQELQGRFVDDPRGAVEAADALVAEVNEALRAEFESCKSELESQWAGDGATDTEELRTALRRYRTFFQRLLAA